MRNTALALAILAAAPAASAFAAPPSLAAILASPMRPAADRARDRYRHPAETLAFFGVRPGQTIVEAIPGGGWYSAILAPLARGRGRYIALVPDAQADKARAMFAARPALFGPAEIATIDARDGSTTLPPASADVILTFRNVHNLLMADDAGFAPAVFRGWFRALKPGGTLGIVDHRLPEDSDTALERTSGYVKRSTIVRLAAGAGFRLVGESAVNANPRDDHDHPQGVWTLPPVLALGDRDRAKWLAIGESDRVTLRFEKPPR